MTALLDLAHQVEALSFSGPPPPTHLQDQPRRYLAFVEAEHSPRTLRHYRVTVRQFTAWLSEQGLTFWSEFDRELARGFVRHLRESGCARTTVATKIGALRGFGKWLVAEGEMPSNRLTLLEPPRHRRRLPGVLSVQQVMALLEQPDWRKPAGLRDRALLEVLYSTAMRSAEALALRVQDVPDQATPIVMGKGGEERVAFLGKPAREWLRRYLEHGRPRFRRYRHLDALWLTREGPMGDRVLRHNVTLYAKAAGLRGQVSPHTLRHSAATHLMDGGANLREVQLVLGHARLTTTQIYTHTSVEKIREDYLRAHPLAREGD